MASPPRRTNGGGRATGGHRPGAARDRDRRRQQSGTRAAARPRPARDAGRRPAPTGAGRRAGGDGRQGAQRQGARRQGADGRRPTPGPRPGRSSAHDGRSTTGRTQGAQRQGGRPDRQAKDGQAKNRPARNRQAKEGQGKNRPARNRQAKEGQGKNRPAGNRQAKDGQAKNRPATGRKRQAAPQGAARRNAGNHPPGTERQPFRDTGDPRKRSVALLVVLIVLMTVISGQLLRVQVLDSSRYVEYGEDQRMRGIDLVGGRGQILDRNEDVLVTDAPRQTLVADQRAVVDPAQTARDLARIVDIDPGVLYPRLNGDALFSYVARQIGDEVATEVEAAGIDGVWLIDEPLRLNPNEDLGLSVLGTTDPYGQGISGLEQAYDTTLAGEDGYMVVERDAEGRTIPGGRQDGTPSERGDDLILTLDGTLQFHIEQILADHIEATGARGGTVIVSDPASGEIFSLVNMEADEESGDVVPSAANAAVVDTYEPGSVLKALVMAAGLEEGAVTPESTYDVPPNVERGGHLFQEERCTENRPYTAAEILADSCNVGTIQIAEDVGPTALYDYLMAFGFDGPTGLEFPDEADAVVGEPESWSGSTLASMSLGQGIAISPMQLHFAYNTIANDGLYVPPTLVASVVDEDGVRHPVEEGVPRRVVSTEAATEVQGMMTGVVTDGTGGPAAIDGYDVAGKTGTARKPHPDGGYEWSDGYRYVTTFAGFLPASDPELSVLVVLDEPENPSASRTAAPVFADVARQAALSLGVPPAA